MRIAVIGTGNVGGAIAIRLAEIGHDVSAARSPGQELPAALVAAGVGAGPVREILGDAEVVVLAVPFGAVPDVLGGCADLLAGKVLIDCTNPVGPGLTHGLDSVRGGSQLVAELAPGARVVKAFSVYGAENFADNSYPDANVLPAMLFCGDDAEAKAVVAGLLSELGWEPVDVGGLEQSLHLEHMTLLWVRMVRFGGLSPYLVWAKLAK